MATPARSRQIPIVLIRKGSDAQNAMTERRDSEGPGWGLPAPIASFDTVSSAEESDGDSDGEVMKQQKKKSRNNNTPGGTRSSNNPAPETADGGYSETSNSYKTTREENKHLGHAKAEIFCSQDGATDPNAHQNTGRRRAAAADEEEKTATATVVIRTEQTTVDGSSMEGSERTVLTAPPSMTVVTVMASEAATSGSRHRYGADNDNSGLASIGSSGNAHWQQEKKLAWRAPAAAAAAAPAAQHAHIPRPSPAAPAGLLQSAATPDHNYATTMEDAETDATADCITVKHPNADDIVDVSYDDTGTAEMAEQQQQQEEDDIAGIAEQQDEQQPPVEEYNYATETTASDEREETTEQLQTDYGDDQGYTDSREPDNNDYNGSNDVVTTTTTVSGYRDESPSDKRTEDRYDCSPESLPRTSGDVSPSQQASPGVAQQDKIRIVLHGDNFERPRSPRKFQPANGSPTEGKAPAKGAPSRPPPPKAAPVRDSWETFDAKKAPPPQRPPPPSAAARSATKQSSTEQGDSDDGDDSGGKTRSKSGSTAKETNGKRVTKATGKKDKKASDRKVAIERPEDEKKDDWLKFQALQDRIQQTMQKTKETLQNKTENEELINKLSTSATNSPWGMVMSGDPSLASNTAAVVTSPSNDPATKDGWEGFGDSFSMAVIEAKAAADAVNAETNQQQSPAISIQKPDSQNDILGLYSQPRESNVQANSTNKPRSNVDLFSSDQVDPEDQTEDSSSALDLVDKFLDIDKKPTVEETKEPAVNTEEDDDDVFGVRQAAKTSASKSPTTVSASKQATSSPRSPATHVARERPRTSVSPAPNLEAFAFLTPPPNKAEIKSQDNSVNLLLDDFNPRSDADYELDAAVVDDTAPEAWSKPTTAAPKNPFRTTPEHQSASPAVASKNPFLTSESYHDSDSIPHIDDDEDKVRQIESKLSSRLSSTTDGDFDSVQEKDLPSADDWLAGGTSAPTFDSFHTSHAAESGDRRDEAQSGEYIEEDPIDYLEPLTIFREKFTGDGWNLLLRYPFKKKLTHHRMWKPVFIRLAIHKNAPTVRLYHTKDDKDPFHELVIQPNTSVCDLGLQQYDNFIKCHTIKIQHTVYRERVGIKAERIAPTLGDLVRVRDVKSLKNLVHKPKTTMILDHAPQETELLKLATLDYEVIKSFHWELEDAMFRMEVKAEKCVTQYTKDEVTIDIVDHYECHVDKDGHVTDHKALVRLFCLAFLTGSPKIEIGLNDKRRHGQEVVGRHDIIPIKTEEWIRIEDCEFSSLISQNEFETTKLLTLVPPDACQVEIMRFRARPKLNRELPLQIRIQMSVVERHIEIRGEVMIPGYFTTSRRANQSPCEDIMIAFPMPEAWIYYFRVERRFRYGSKHSSHRKAGKIKGLERITAMAQGMLSSSLIEVSTGSAKYEHVFRAVVWRIAKLPDRNEGAYKTHVFELKLDLAPHDPMPETFEKQSLVEFRVTNSTVSRAQVRSIGIVNSPCDEPPDRWVHHLARYRYTVDIEFTDKPLKDALEHDLSIAAMRKPKLSTSGSTGGSESGTEGGEGTGTDGGGSHSEAADSDDSTDSDD